MQGTTFKAILTSDVEYSNLKGQKFKIIKGEEVDVMVIRIASPHIDVLGRKGTEQKDSYIGLKAGHRFDLEAAEFKTVD